MKQLITIAAFVLAASALTNRCAAGTDAALTVKMKIGKVHGKAMNNGKVHAWLGMPHAAAPVGDLR